MDFSEEVSDICVELLDHIADRLFKLSALFFDALLLDVDLCGEGVEQLGSFVQGLVIFLGEGVVDAIEVLEPSLDRLELGLIPLVQLFLDLGDILFKLNEFL